MPDGAVVFSTDDDGFTGILSAAEGGELHTHPGVETWDEIREILNQYPAGSVTAIVFVGHGSSDGGIQAGDQYDTTDDIAASTIPSDVATQIDDVLIDDGKIYVMSCCQFISYTAQHLQLLANLTGHPVVANEGSVWYTWDWAFWMGIFFWDANVTGDGNWVEIAPLDIELTSPYQD